MEHPRVRPFRRNDTDAVTALSLRAWEPVFGSFEVVLGHELYRRIYPDWRSQQTEAVAAALEENETWVSVGGSKILGFVNVIFQRDEASGEVYMIAVDPALQRRGVATELTEFALAEMRRRGLTLATVSTGGDPGHHPARAAYSKLGFTPFPQVLYAKILDEDDEWILGRPVRQRWSRPSGATTLGETTPL